VKETKYRRKRKKERSNKNLDDSGVPKGKSVKHVFRSITTLTFAIALAISSLMYFIGAEMEGKISAISVGATLISSIAFLSSTIALHVDSFYAFRHYYEERRCSLSKKKEDRVKEEIKDMVEEAKATNCKNPNHTKIPSSKCRHWRKTKFKNEKKIENKRFRSNIKPYSKNIVFFLISFSIILAYVVVIGLFVICWARTNAHCAEKCICIQESICADICYEVCNCNDNYVRIQECICADNCNCVRKCKQDGLHPPFLKMLGFVAAVHCIWQLVLFVSMIMGSAVAVGNEPDISVESTSDDT
jgi:hypothetical protein